MWMYNKDWERQADEEMPHFDSGHNASHYNEPVYMENDHMALMDADGWWHNHE